MATKIAPIAYGIFGGICLLRGLFRPHRAVVRKGGVARCSGTSSFGTCDPSDAIQADPGTNVYAVVAGRVAAVGDRFVHVVAGSEPVVVMCDGIVPGVIEGQYVGRGQRIGTVGADGTVYFSVTEMVRSEGPLGYTMAPLPPSAWLASRGVRHAAKNTGDGSRWCEGGRNIQVPQGAMSSCDFKRPEPGMFGLLPITVDMG
jgi:hypothetical protein